MYKYLTNIYKTLFWIFFILFFSQNTIFGFNLIEELKSYTEDTFFWNDAKQPSTKLSKDPFWDAMQEITDTSNNIRSGWVKYIANMLTHKWCSMKNEEIIWILYAYVPEFRADTTRDLKMKIWNYDNSKYVLDDDTITKYCEKYFSCIQASQSNSNPNEWITARTSSDIKTNCKEFFQANYKEWEENEKIKQNLENSNPWFDTYRNKSTEDSTYDIMTNLGILAKLLYHDAEEPVFVHYNSPNFSNSKNNSKNDSPNTSNIKSNESTDNETNSESRISRWNINDENNNDNWSTNENDNQSETNNWWFEKLVEWLNSSKDSNNLINYNNPCKDEDTNTEPEEPSNHSNTWGSYTPELWEEEYQEIINYLWNSVNEYSSLPKDKLDEIEKMAWDKSNLGWESSAEEIEASIKKIKNCWGSCDGLRIDQKASCMVKCACWEITSAEVNLFNPEKNPELWPIFMIRFCAVPAINAKFSIWWKKIHSIEEWLEEIYWVNDKLSREWRLWKRTQQNEFLDSSTKQMNLADTFAFTINVEFVDISNRFTSPSQLHKETEIKSDNQQQQMYYWISNPLNIPEKKNTYAIIWWDKISNYPAPEPLLDPNENSYANHYNTFSEYFHKWFDQQWSLWIKTTNDITDMNTYTINLINKQCKK